MPINENISAAVFIGAYTTQMLIAKKLPDGNSFEMINQFTTFTNMDMNRTEGGLISEAGMQRVLSSLHKFHEVALQEGVSTFRVAATSSLRNAPNRSILLLGCQKEFDLFPSLLSGRDEARLNFIGAITDAMANLPVVATYAGYNNFYFSYGTASRIDGAFELDLSVAEVNDLYRKRKHHRFNLFRQIAIHAYIMKKLSVLSADYKKWRAGLSIEPEFMAVGPLPFGCLALLSKYPAFDSVEAISAIPQTTSALVELSRSLSSQSQEAIAKMPGMDQQLAPVIAAGAMVLRCTLEMTGSYEFRVTPYGICAGILRSPSYLFTQPGQ